MDSAQLWRTLESAPQPPGHLAAWEYLLAEMQPYPGTASTRPWRAPRGSAPTRMLAVAQIHGPVQRPLALEVLAPGQYQQTIILTDRTSATITSDLARCLLPTCLRGAMIVFPDGARQGFHSLLHHYARGLVEDGYELQPIAANADIRAIRIRRHDHSWWLVDLLGLTGLGAEEWPHDLSSLAQSLHAYESFVAQHIGVPLRLTVGATAMYAAQRSLPADDWLWRPAPYVVALARAGKGYRGGYGYAERYRGPAWKYDQNRCYLSCLREQLPLRKAFGPCISHGKERAGLFVCSVTGRGSMPVYLHPFSGEGFAKARQWDSGTAVCVLPTSEISGLRALGYAVEPGWGAITTRSVKLRSFVENLESILRGFSRDSWQAKATKIIGNAVYGKFGESPWRNSLQYAPRRPGNDWHPFITSEGLDVPYLWVRREYATRPHQQVDIAAHITGLARTRLYQMAETMIAQQCGIVMADTDSLTVQRPPRRVRLDDVKLGGWRLEAHDPDAIIVAERKYKIGELVRGFGPEHREPELVELAYKHGTFTVGKQRLAAPWQALG